MHLFFVTFPLSPVSMLPGSRFSPDPRFQASRFPSFPGSRAFPVFVLTGGHMAGNRPVGPRIGKRVPIVYTYRYKYLFYLFDIVAICSL